MPVQCALYSADQFGQVLAGMKHVQDCHRTCVGKTRRTCDGSRSPGAGTIYMVISAPIRVTRSRSMLCTLYCSYSRIYMPSRKAGGRSTTLHVGLPASCISVGAQRAPTKLERPGWKIIYCCTITTCCGPHAEALDAPFAAEPKHKRHVCCLCCANVEVAPSRPAT